MNKKLLTKTANKCQVCSKLAVGYHYGAYVCEACKKFFIRHSSGVCRLSGNCVENGTCDLAIIGRGKCQHCRIKRCHDIGMSISQKSSDYDLSVIPCQVCGSKSSGVHFGCITCEGCKGFFRRMTKFKGTLVCHNSKKCELRSKTRSSCKSCRMERCLHIGMSRNEIRIGRHPNAMKYDCLNSMKCDKSHDNEMELIAEDTNFHINFVDDDKLLLSDTEFSCDDEVPNKEDDGNDKEHVLSHEMIVKAASLILNNDDVDINIQDLMTTDSDKDDDTFELAGASLKIEKDNPTSLIDEVPGKYVFEKDSLNELEDGVTQIINNESPSIAFLTQKDQNIINWKINEFKSLDSRHIVWASMMDHFVLHSKFIVKFAKSIPGFSRLSLADKRIVIKNTMYPVILLKLSQDYCEINGEVFFNYFDFSAADRAIILTFFPEFIDFSNHLKKCGAIKYLMKLNAVEITLMCGIIIFYNYDNLDGRTFGQSMYDLYLESLMVYFKSKLSFSITEANDRMKICLDFVSLLDDMNILHHRVITDFCVRHSELQYPDLYKEMFNN